MNWVKPNFTQWVAIVTAATGLFGYVYHAENDRMDQKIHQHDLEKKVDSIGNQLNLYTVKFDELQANRIATLKTNAEKDRVHDERDDRQELDNAILTTEFKDFKEYYFKQKK